MFPSFAFLVFVAIELNIFPFTAIIKGKYPEETPLGQICLHNTVSSPPNGLGLFIGGVSLIIQFSYTVFFFWRTRRFVRRYGRKLCAIGKYRRNCNSLNTTTFCAFLSCFYPNFNYWFREIIPRSNTTAQFVVQFFFKDFFMELFFTGLFLISASDDIPSEEETPRRTIFYASGRPKYLEPRRPNVPTLLPTPDLDSTAGEVRTDKNLLDIDKDDDLQIPIARVTRNGYKVTLYHATFKRKAKEEDLQRVKANTLHRRENIAIRKETKMLTPNSQVDVGKIDSRSGRFSYFAANQRRDLKMRRSPKSSPECSRNGSQNTTFSSKSSRKGSQNTKSSLKCSRNGSKNAKFSPCFKKGSQSTKFSPECSRNGSQSTKFSSESSRMRSQNTNSSPGRDPKTQNILENPPKGDPQTQNLP